ncbi:MAG: c-type cytochrome [Myxococcota bacterium]
MTRARSYAVAALSLAGFAGLGLGLAHCTRSRPTDARGEELASGARLYRTYCGLCHGDAGEGYAADDANALANQDFLVSVSDEFLRVNIALGHPGTAMAAYAKRAGGPLEDEEIDALVNYIRAWQEEPSADVSDPVALGDAVRGQAAFSRDCASCHGARGGGGSAISPSNRVFLETASDAQIEYAILHGRRGTPMPAFEGELSAATIADLVALIRSWQPEEESEAETIVPDELPEVVLNPDGPPAEFPPLREGRYVPSEAVDRALAAGSRIIFLDARPPSDYVRFHVVGAIPAPYYDVADVAERLPRDGTWIVAYCACPHAASGRVMDYLREQGFTNTAVLDEGVLHWHNEGYPTIEGPSPGVMADVE